MPEETMLCCFPCKKKPLKPPPVPNPGPITADDINLNTIPDGNGTHFPGVPPLPPPVMPKPINNRVEVVALYDFDAITDEDLTFRKGDRMEVDPSSLVDDWWIATHKITRARGFIPSTYVCKDDNSPQAQEWWYNINRKEADKQLLYQGNPPGTFLVRQSTDKESYVLSVRDIDKKTQDAGVKHYRVRKFDNNRGFYISPKRPFENLLKLIAHYQGTQDGLCCSLVVPCPKERPIVQFRDLEVPRESVVTTKELGHGFFGEVYQGRWRGTVDVAVKTLKPGTMSKEAFLEEAKLLHRMTHRKLVQLFAVCTLQEPMYIITELMVNGSFLDYLRKDDGRKLTLMDLVDMAAQIAEGMAYLETKNFVHRDLRAANILVGEHNTVKVADFGLARLVEDDIYEASDQAKFPIKWTAPEAANERRFSIKSDVWSYGILLYEIITFGRVPYPGMPGSEALHRLDRGYRMPKPTGLPIEVPDPYYDIQLKCWHKKPDDRPTFQSLYEYFDDYVVSSESGYRDTGE